MNDSEKQNFRPPWRLVGRCGNGTKLNCCSHTFSARVSRGHSSHSGAMVVAGTGALRAVRSQTGQPGDNSDHVAVDTVRDRVLDMELENVIRRRVPLGGQENGVRYQKPERREGCFAFLVRDPLFQLGF